MKLPHATEPTIDVTPMWGWRLRQLIANRSHREGATKAHDGQPRPREAAGGLPADTTCLRELRAFVVQLWLAGNSSARDADNFRLIADWDKLTVGWALGSVG